MTTTSCPVCHGKGYVPAGFYNPDRGNDGAETCRSCGGRGAVVVEAAVAASQPDPCDLTGD